MKPTRSALEADDTTQAATATIAPVATERRGRTPHKPLLPPGPRPWQRSWLYRAPGETPTLAWIAFLHVAAVVGLVLLPLPSWPVLAVTLLFCWLGGLGTTVAYHRSLAHRSVELNPVVEQGLVFFAVFNGSGTPLSWVSNHRFHHAHSDTELDISSPRQGGFWWAHLRWLWQAEQPSAQRYCPDLIRRGHSRWNKWQYPVLALSLLGGLLLWPILGWQGALAAALWLGPVRLLFALHVQCTVNSLCHLGSMTAEHGSGKNVWWLTPLHLGQGENWHANHHRSHNDSRLGRAWWQIDVGFWTIAVLGRLGLAHKIRTPSANS